MRIYITLTENNKEIPFNYQDLLTSALHRWLGRDNKYHGEQSFYCFSWLQNVSISKSGINLTANSYFFVSSYDANFIKRLMRGIMSDPILFNGSKVKDLQIINSKEFSDVEHFTLASPLFVKRRSTDGNIEHALFSDEDFGKLLTDNFKKKLEKEGIDSSSVEIRVDKDSSRNRTKLINYKEVFNKVNFCPITIKGTQEQIHFAWCVGLGHSTGIGFGALK